MDLHRYTQSLRHYQFNWYSPLAWIVLSTDASGSTLAYITTETGVVIIDPNADCSRIELDLGDADPIVASQSNQQVYIGSGVENRGQLTFVDVESAEIVEQLPLPGRPLDFGISPDEGTLYTTILEPCGIAEENCVIGHFRLGIVDTALRRVEEIVAFDPPEAQPHSVEVAGDGSVYLLSVFDVLLEFDAASHALSEAGRLAPCCYSGFDISPHGETAFFLGGHHSDGWLAVRRLDDFGPPGFIGFDFFEPRAVTSRVGDANAYLLLLGICSRTSCPVELRKLDLSQPELSQSLALGETAARYADISLHGIDELLYVLAGNRLSVVYPDDLRLRATVELDTAARNLAVIDDTPTTLTVRACIVEDLSGGCGSGDRPGQLSLDPIGLTTSPDCSGGFRFEVLPGTYTVRAHTPCNSLGCNVPASVTVVDRDVEIIMPLVCRGDCDHSHEVSVDEVLLGLSLALSGDPVEACLPADTNQDQTITVDEILSALHSALLGCPA